MAKGFFSIGLIVALGAGLYLLFSGTGGGSTGESIVLSSLEATKAQTVEVTQKRAPVADTEMPVPSPNGPWPKAVARDTSYSFGRMQVRDTKTHQFQIKNEGDAELRLTAGKPTCKCTQFGFGDSSETTTKTAVVPPGESITLTMSWKAGDVADREFRHGGDVYTNDPKNLELKFSVQGAIEMPFELLPYAWNVGDVYSDKPGTMTATLGSRIHENLEILSVESQSGKVTVNHAPVGVEEKATNAYTSGFSLSVTVASDIPSGIFEDEVSIQLAQQDDPIRVKVTARKQGAIRLQQMAGTLFEQDKMLLHLGSFPASEGRDAKMLLIVDEKDMSESFALTETSADPSFVKAELTPVGAPSGTVHRYILTISVPPGRPHVQKVTTAPGMLRLSTNHPSGESIQLGLVLYSN